MDTWLVVLIGIQVSFVAFLLWLVAHYRLEKSRQRTDERMRLLERFDSAEELQRFLETDAGQGFLESGGKADPMKILGLGLGAGVISLCLGAGLFIADSKHGIDEMALPGTVLLSLGIGMFLAVFVSMFLLQRRSRGNE